MKPRRFEPSIVSAPTPGKAPIDIEKLFRQHNAALLRFAASKLGSEQEARDVAQEAYVRLLQLDRPETVSYLRAFLFKTVSNLAIDRLRVRRRTPPMCPLTDGDFAVFELSPERQCDGQQTLAIIARALAELPPKCGRIFLMHRMSGLSRSEIAAQFGLGERMVRLYIARALEHLRRRLDEAFEDTPQQ